MQPLLPSFLLLLAAANAAASETPRCTPALDGAVACLDGKLCACRYDSGGPLTGRRAGNRWDCGTLRPACGPVAPADLGGGQAPRDLSPFLPMPPPTGWR